jgi:hypothetical protein
MDMPADNGIRPRPIICIVVTKGMRHCKLTVLFWSDIYTLVCWLSTLAVIARVFLYDIMVSSILDLHYGSFDRGKWCNCTVWSELMVSCQCSHHNLVRGSTCCYPGLVTAHSQLSESAHIVTMILSEASHAIAQDWLEPTVSCLSPHI